MLLVALVKSKALVVQDKDSALMKSQTETDHKVGISKSSGSSRTLMDPLRDPRQARPQWEGLCPWNIVLLLLRLVHSGHDLEKEGVLVTLC